MSAEPCADRELGYLSPAFCAGGSALAFDRQGGTEYSVSMKYRVRLEKSDEGVAVSVPGLPGCWSQGATEAEALENIADAIREYLAVVDSQLAGSETREIDVAV